MKKLMIVLSILLIFGSSDLHGQTQRQITPADAYRMYLQRMYEQQQRAYQQQQQRYREQQQAYQQQLQRYQQQMRENQQRVRTAMMYRDRRPGANPLIPFKGEGGGGIYVPSTPVRRGPTRGFPQSDPYRSGNEDINRTRFEIEQRNGAARSLQDDKLREMANQAERDRQDRDSYSRQNERYMDRMATRAGQTTQPQRLTERMGLGKLAPDISRKDVERLKDYYGIRDLGNNNGRSAPQRSTPQRRDSSDRSRSGNSSRSGGGSSNRSESKDWREANRERLDRVGNH